MFMTNINKNLDTNGQNVTRQTIPRDPEDPVDHLSTGYPEQPELPPTDFNIPSCGIYDCDAAVKRLFNKDLPFTMKTVNGANGPIYLKKPAVIFAAGERFALVKRLRPLRDKNGALILPAISIRSTGITQTYEDMSSRGINQTTGEIVIKRRFDGSDMDYQNFINKIGLQNRPYDGSSTSRQTGQDKNDPAIKEGMLLDPRINRNNIWEIIAIPQPQYITCTYEIVFWTTHTEHMNYMVETLLSAQLPQIKGFKLVAESGYWFMSYLEDNIESQDNFNDFTEEKRIVRRAFTLKVLGFILAPDGSNRMVPVKRYISAPMISFDVKEGDVITKKQQEQIEQISDPFALENLDEETADMQKPTTEEKFLVKRDSVDPVTGKKITRYVRINDREKGKRETYYTASDPETLAQFLFSNGTPDRNK